MFCFKCGDEICDQAIVCPKCGVPTIKSSYLDIKETAPNSIGALTCGILSVMLPIIGFVFAIIGLCLSISGRKKVSNEPLRYGPTAMLKAANVLSIIGLVYPLLFILFISTVGVALMEFISDTLYF